MKEVETIDAKHIFIDIVNYTYNRSVEAQTDLISYLNQIVKAVFKEKKIKDNERLFIPTGDGMCISILNINKPYDIHLLIALSILEKIKAHNDTTDDEMRKFSIRIGINENIDNLIIDINQNQNISGSGINIAARIEGLCDSNQIFVSNTVFEKLAHREKYMKSFQPYSAEVKHGLPLKVYQYRNLELAYINNDVPSKFKIAPKKTIRLTPVQAYYIANCIKLEEFINDNIDSGQSQYSLVVLLYQLSEDYYAKSKVTKTSNSPTVRVKRPLQEHFNFIQSVDFWIICDLRFFITRENLSEITNYFSEPFLYVGESGKNKLAEDYPEICKEFEIK